MPARAAILLTGNELLWGRIEDRNAPFLTAELERAGVEVAYSVVCGDRERDLMRALEFMEEAGVDLIVTSGGLGPTEDDLTAEAVARFAGVALRLDLDVERRIEETIAPFAARWKLDREALRKANRKQALVPEGAIALGPVGTAPGLVVETGGVVVVVLPGPPQELQRTWREAVATAPVARLLGRSQRLEERVMRLFGMPESELTVTLRELGDEVDLSAVEVTTCARDGELEIVVRGAPDAMGAAGQIADRLRDRHRREFFSEEGSTVDEIVADLLTGSRATVAVAESCTGGALAKRLTDAAGASAYFKGGTVVYSNRSKVSQLGVDPAILDAHGAVSEPVATGMAAGAMSRFAADYAVAVSGVAGPSGGTEHKPVGTVCVAVAGPDGAAGALTVLLPGDRDAVRRRATVIAMHRLRETIERR